VPGGRFNRIFVTQILRWCRSAEKTQVLVAVNPPFCNVFFTRIHAVVQIVGLVFLFVGPFMRIKVHCQNRIGILRDMLNLLVEYGINVARGEVGGEHGNAIYLHCPNLINLQFQALRPKFEAITGVFGVKRVGLMPSERRHMELNALLGALDFPVLSIDMGGSIVAANRSAAQLLGVRVDAGVGAGQQVTHQRLAGEDQRRCVPGRYRTAAVRAR
jgi:hypothetical protein